MAGVTQTVCVRVSSDVVEQMDDAAGRAGQSRSQWLQDAITLGLIATAEDKTPQVIKDARPKLTRRGMRMPRGRTYDRL